MKYEYDAEVDGLYIWFVDDIDNDGINYEKEIWPIELKNEVGFLFDKTGKLMGLEFLPASKYFSRNKIEEMSNMI